MRIFLTVMISRKLSTNWVLWSTPFRWKEFAFLCHIQHVFHGNITDVSRKPLADSHFPMFTKRYPHVLPYIFVTWLLFLFKQTECANYWSYCGGSLIFEFRDPVPLSPRFPVIDVSDCSDCMHVKCCLNNAVHISRRVRSDSMSSLLTVEA